MSLTPTDVNRLAQMLAEDPAQPFDMASSCSFRTDLMIGRLLEAGVPAGSIARVYQAVPKGDSSKMHADHDSEPQGDFPTLLGLSSAPITGKPYPLKGTDLNVTFDGKGSVLVQNESASVGWDKGERGKGYELSATNKPWQGENHITIGLYQRDPETGITTLKVIDPHLSQDDPVMTPEEWKAAVHCEPSVVMAGRIGEMAHILHECLSDSQRETFDAAVCAEGASRYTLTRQQENAVTQRMYNLGSPEAAEEARNLSSVINWRFPDIGEEMNYKEQHEKDKARTGIDDKVSTDWNNIKPDEQVGLVQRWIAELHPLRVIQEKMNEKFPPSAPKHEASSTASAKQTISPPAHAHP